MSNGWAWGIVLAVLGLAACAQPQVPPDRFYRIEAPPSAKPMVRQRFNGPLEVEDVSASGLVAGRAIIYADSAQPNALEAYSYHFWAEPPALMLRDEVSQCLRSTGVAEVVVTEKMRIDPDYSLVSRLERLERLTGAQPKVVVEMEFALRDNDRRRLLDVTTYRVEAVPAADTIDSAVNAFTTAFAEICTRLASDLARR